MRIADLFTLASLVAGILAFASVTYGKLTLAGILLIVALIMDYLDGRVARLRKETSTFGMYLDSLTDVVVFGAVPALIGLFLLPTRPFVLACVICFVAAGIFRLARFQISTNKKSFVGVPITANGLLFGIILIFAPESTYLWLFPSYYIALSILMVSTIKVRKP